MWFWDQVVGPGQRQENDGTRVCDDVVRTLSAKVKLPTEKTHLRSEPYPGFQGLASNYHGIAKGTQGCPRGHVYNPMSVTISFRRNASLPMHPSFMKKREEQRCVFPL